MAKYLVVVGLGVVIAAGALGGEALPSRSEAPPAQATAASTVGHAAATRGPRGRRGRRGLRGFKGSKGAQGVPGPQGLQGPAGPTVVNTLSRFEVTATIAAGDVDSVTVNCPGGQGVVSGGYRSISADGEVFFQDSFGSPNSWSVGLDNFDSPISGSVTAVAYCAPSAQAVAPRAGRVASEARTDAAVAVQRDRHR